MARRFENKTVFITGASAGIGAALARAFAQEGARVGLAARRVDRLESLQSDIEAMGGQAVAVACDVTDRTSIDAAVTKVVDTFGGLDVVVANAGFGVSGYFMRVNTDAFRRQFDTNVFGLIDTVHAVLPHLIRSKGRLGLVASVAGELASPQSGAYSASKFAVVGLAETLYYELAAFGVSVTCIEPGFIETEFRSVDNRGVYRPERKDPIPAWICVKAPKAAHAILNALYARRYEAVISFHGKLLVAFHRHFPRTFRMLIAFTARRVFKKKQTRTPAR